MIKSPCEFVFRRSLFSSIDNNKVHAGLDKNYLKCESVHNLKSWKMLAEGNRNALLDMEMRDCFNTTKFQKHLTKHPRDDLTQ